MWSVENVTEMWCAFPTSVAVLIFIQEHIYKIKCMHVSVGALAPTEKGGENGNCSYSSWSKTRTGRQTISYCHGQCKLHLGKINIANLLPVVTATSYTQPLSCGSRHCGDRVLQSGCRGWSLVTRSFWPFSSVSVRVLQPTDPRFFFFSIHNMNTELHICM